MEPRTTPHAIAIRTANPTVALFGIGFARRTYAFPLAVVDMLGGVRHQIRQANEFAKRPSQSCALGCLLRIGMALEEDFEIADLPEDPALSGPHRNLNVHVDAATLAELTRDTRNRRSTLKRRVPSLITAALEIDHGLSLLCSGLAGMRATLARVNGAEGLEGVPAP